MPKDSFLKLSAVKRTELSEKMIAYFLDHSLDTLNKSELVLFLGIGKGTLYNYFEDEVDIYIYLLDYLLNDPTATIANQNPKSFEEFADFTLRHLVSHTDKVKNIVHYRIYQDMKYSTHKKLRDKIKLEDELFLLRFEPYFKKAKELKLFHKDVTWKQMGIIIDIVRLYGYDYVRSTPFEDIRLFERMFELFKILAVGIVTSNQHAHEFIVHLEKTIQRKVELANENELF